MEKLAALVPRPEIYLIFQYSIIPIFQLGQGPNIQSYSHARKKSSYDHHRHEDEKDQWEVAAQYMAVNNYSNPSMGMCRGASEIEFKR